MPSDLKQLNISTSQPFNPAMSHSRIFIAGHNGMVGRAIVRALQRRASGLTNLEIVTRDRSALDLTDQTATQNFFREMRPTHVILAAAKVGGIKANRDAPVDFLLENLKIQNNVIESAHSVGVGKLLFISSSCVYPKHAPQPMREDSLFTGSLEPSNQWYAVAKLAGMKLCEAYREQHGHDFISAMPTNLYGPWDNFDPDTAHALPAMITKFHRAKISGAKSVKLWGSGSPRREWLHVDDAAEACLVLMEKFSEPQPINVGVGADLTISELAETIGEIVGFEGKIEWDTSQPDGPPRKLLDIDRIRALGWKPRIELRNGIQTVYEWFLRNAEERC